MNDDNPDPKNHWRRDENKCGDIRDFSDSFGFLLDFKEVNRNSFVENREELVS
jgi:hypothetical protein